MTGSRQVFGTRRKRRTIVPLKWMCHPALAEAFGIEIKVYLDGDDFAVIKIRF